MSEELEWELFEIFESGTFVFPIYEHNSARRIISYLLMRGILDEEIAEAIEDSTIDLHLWLNRVQGKFMVGEWVIAWMNDCREEYERERGYDGESFKENHAASREMTPLTMCTNTTYDEDDNDDDIEQRSECPSRVTCADTTSFKTASTAERDDDSSSSHSESQSSHTHSPKMFRRIRDKNGELPKHRRARRPADLEFLQDSYVLCNGLYMDPPDSGNVSDIYHPRDMIHFEECMKHGNGKPSLPVCDNCTCAFIHYSYQDNKPEKHKNDNDLDFDLDNKTQCQRAMELTYETLDKDGPGFIFILTDSKHSTLSWSTEHCYKIASSRQPERCVTEFRDKRVNVDLIWKVKVRRHIEAINEVHSHLTTFNVHSNWFKCSLSAIMDVVSKTVRQFRV